MPKIAQRIQNGKVYVAGYLDEVNGNLNPNIQGQDYGSIPITAPPGYNPATSILTTINAWASDPNVYVLNPNMASLSAAFATTYKGGTAVSYNAPANVNQAATYNAGTMVGPGIVNVVWSNLTTANHQLTTDIINGGGKVINMVFSIGFSTAAYSGTEMNGLPSAYQLLQSSSQVRLSTPSSHTFLTKDWLGILSGQSFTTSNYFAAGSPPFSTSSQPASEIFLRQDTTNYNYGAVYKSGGPSAPAIAIIYLWPGDFYGNGGSTVNDTILHQMIARLALYMCN
jgi:hypothetical protein